ncbi:MAG: leucine-rich repeat domain-containing protein [Oscillospiraceae bacterium]|nr:leucine-rich repeat domain-containing protein [Oscillospiraceae bacterium]
MPKKRKPVYNKRKSIVLRIIILIVAAALLLGILIMPLSHLLYAFEGEELTVSEFETGRLGEALLKAADGTDFNNIAKASILSGTLSEEDYNALLALPNLTHLELRGTQTELGIIPENALPSRNQLTYISLPKNTAVIGARAFLNNKRLEKVDMPFSVNRIEDYAFDGCISLGSIPISENIVYIGAGAFRDCQSIVNFIIPSGVTAIYDDTFSKCGFEELHIGANIESIGERAFADCNNLRDIYAYSVTPPALGNEAFRNVNAVIHVYEDSLKDYESWAGNNIRVADSLVTAYNLMAIIPNVNEVYYAEADLESVTEAAETAEYDLEQEASTAQNADAEVVLLSQHPALCGPKGAGFGTIAVVAVVFAAIGALASYFIVTRSRKTAESQTDGQASKAEW